MSKENLKQRKKCMIKSRVTSDMALYLLNRTRIEGKTQSDLIRELIENDREARNNTEVAQAKKNKDPWKKMN